MALMDCDEFELFQHLPDGSLSWRGVVHSLGAAQMNVWRLAQESLNECFAMDVTRGEIVLARTPLGGVKRIFQIAYSEELAIRGHLLPREDFDVTSVTGNEVAHFVLRSHPAYNLFMIGHAASDPVRSEMAHWLRTHYPEVRIVSLNRFGHTINSLRHTVPSYPAAAWLTVIAAVVGRRAACEL
jgi:hypothetical protein